MVHRVKKSLTVGTHFCSCSYTRKNCYLLQVLLSTRTRCSCSTVAPVSSPQCFVVRMTWVSPSRVVVLSDLLHFDLNSLREFPQEKWSLTDQGVWRNVCSQPWHKLTLKSCGHLNSLSPKAPPELLFPAETEVFNVFLQCTVQWTPVDSITLAYSSWQNIGYVDIICCYKHQGGKAGVKNPESF